MPSFCRHRRMMTLLALALAGCAPTTPQQRLVGKWKGTPQMREAVDAAVESASQGQTVNPLAQGAARFLGNALAKATMSVDLDLRPSGAVFLRGNTEVLGMPPDSDGSWTLASADADMAQIEFEVAGKTLAGKILFHDANEFTLKFELPAPPGGGPSAGKPATDSGTADRATNPTPEAQLAKADVAARTQLQPTSIVFHRVSSSW